MNSLEGSGPGDGWQKCDAILMPAPHKVLPRAVANSADLGEKSSPHNTLSDQRELLNVIPRRVCMRLNKAFMSCFRVNH